MESFQLSQTHALTLQLERAVGLPGWQAFDEQFSQPRKLRGQRLANNVAKFLFEKSADQLERQEVYTP